MSLKLTLLSFALLLPLGACSSAPTARRYDDVKVGNNKRHEIELRGDVVKACDVYTDKAYFEYNSEQLDDNDRIIVQEIGKCMTKGRLAGRSVLVTGFADQDGTRPYNRELGLERAKAIAHELERVGISPKRVYVRSRGERGAKGTTDIGKAWDRKVEIDIVAPYR